MTIKVLNSDYVVRLIKMPLSVRGAVTPNDDGTYSVYINSDISDDEQRKALDHELRHIELNHFSSDKDIKTIEDEADGKTVPTPPPPTPKLPPLNTEDSILCFSSLDAFARYVKELQKEADCESTRTEKTAER